jgi:hypothetical protein
MVETLEGLGMLPTGRESTLDRFFNRRGPAPQPGAPGDAPDPARPMPTLPVKRGNTGIIPPWLRRPAAPTHTPPKPLFPIFSVPPHTPPVLLPGVLSPAAPASNAAAPQASAITSTYAPTYSPADVADETTWTPPDDALVSDQWGLDEGVDRTLQDDLYASQDYQADGEGNSLWGLGDAWDVIPNVLPQAIPTDTSSSSSGGWLSSLGNFVQSALPAAAQVYASVQATKQGNPVAGSAIAQGARPVMTGPMPLPGAGYPGGYSGALGGYGAPSWFSQRTILPSMSNGAVVGLAAAATLGLLVVLKHRRGA